MSKDINVTDGTVLETLNNKVDLDGGNYVGSGLEDIIEQTHISSKITNCITEIPQRVKLELNNGTLTLKAGSVVTVPNGFEADGTTPRFDYITVESDVVRTGTVNTTGISMAYYSPLGSLIVLTVVGDGTTNNYFSGATAPTSTNYMTWYDTANNTVKTTSDKGVTWHSGSSLPLGIVSYSADSAGFTSIDQVFNGMGYIGSTVWVDKGVKGLIPNGRNTDGTLNNIEFTTTSFVKYTFPLSYNYQKLAIGLRQANTLSFYTTYKYDNLNNYNTISTGRWDVLFLGTTNTTDGKITKFQPKLPFRAVDYNDKTEISGWGMPSSKYIDLTLGASGTSYTAPANGWVFISANVSTAGGYVQIYKNTYSVLQRVVTADTTAICMMPVKKGEAYNMYYTTITKTNMFRFIYAEGEQ